MSKKRVSIWVGLLCLFVVPVLAQQSTLTDPPATKEQILKFMDLMHVKQQMGQMFDGMRAQARLGAEQGFKQKVPNPTPAQLAKVHAIADEIFAGFPVDELLDAMVPIYQKHLTQPDLDAIIAFYSSPVGQRFVKEVPAMMAEGMQAGGDIGRRRMTEANQRIEEKVEALANEMGQAEPAKTVPKAKP